MQGVIKSYDPGTKDGVVMSERNFTEYELSPNALDGSIFRMLRQGQRVILSLMNQEWPRIFAWAPKWTWELQISCNKLNTRSRDDRSPPT